jgi:enoyl-CoA hydratase
MTYEGFETLRVSIDGPIALVTINREAVRNALSTQVIAELTACVGELEVSTEVRAVILTGAGDKAFVAGADIAEMHELTPNQAHAFAEMGGALGASIESSEKPWIAAVNGFALGGGTELALVCDFIHASDQAKFGQPEVKLGVIPGFGGTQRLARRIGLGMARELIFSGRLIGPEEALRIGLCNAVVPRRELTDRVMEVARAIAANGPGAVTAAKRVMREGADLSLAAAIELEAAAFSDCFDLRDQKEGMGAFLEKREPKFAGS